MRRMISTKKARALDSIEVSEDGTKVVIGGNVGFEGVEQIGIAETVHNDTGVVTIISPTATHNDGVLATGVTEKTGNWNDGGPTMGEGVLYAGSGLWFCKINGHTYNTSGSGGTGLEVKGDKLTLTAAGQQTVARGEISFTPKGDSVVFTPLFTEAEYEKLKELAQE